MSPLFGFAWTNSALTRLSTIPSKQRAQITKKARALIVDPHPPGSKKLHGITTDDGEPVYRQRAGDYRILYAVNHKPHSVVVVLDVDDRKDVYR